MDPRFLTFGLENAESVHRHTHELLWFLLSKPRAKYPALVEWADIGKALIADPSD
jgi:hypothetical protein